MDDRADPNGPDAPGVRRDRDPVGSIWRRVSRALHPPLHGDRDAEVVVVGAGIVGLTAALELARAGRSVVLLEARRIGDGTTGRSTAKVSALQGTRYSDIQRIHGVEVARNYATAQVESLAWIDQQVRDLSIECDWERRTSVTYATTDEGAQTVRDEAEAARAAGLDVRTTGDLGLPFATTAAVFLDDQAQFSPVAYLEALAAEVDRLPTAAIHEWSRVTAIKGRGPHRVVTTHGTVTAEHVVVATLMPITDRAMFFARAKPTASYTVAVAVDGDLPPHMYISADSPTRSLRTARRHDAAGGTSQVLLVGGEGSKVASGPMPSVAIARLQTWAHEHFAVTDIAEAWSAHDHTPVDHLPWVGPTSPLTPRVVAATGFEKWGMTMGTAAARLLAQNIVAELAGDTPPGWSSFDPRRVAVTAWPTTARLNLEVAQRLATDWIRPDVPADAHGKGRRFRSGVFPAGDPDGGTSVDEPADVGETSGSSREVRVVCTHLGGVCRWNDVEHTWDCPLHGSRFDADGTVVAGPAVRPLSSP